ncbi:hypothetical protein [Streptomyces sp. NPDC053079]|uniref:hypothetical protein n=1 Tax=Streptomyces sp. NPDC053079 TaxID=3365697 RepID=UPI0037CFA925
MPLLSSVDLRPSVHHSTIDIGAIAFSQQPDNDDVVMIPAEGLRLSSHDPSFYPAMTLEHLSHAPESTPPGGWDYQRIFNGVTLGDNVSVLGLFGTYFGQLNLPSGRYDLRLLRRRDEAPVRGEEPPQVIDDTLDEDEEDEVDGPTEDAVEHWLIQFWPSTE